MKYLMIDMDGTICELSGCSGKIWMTNFPEGFFLNKRPLISIINTIQTKYSDEEFCKIAFTSSPDSITDREKAQWLKEHNLNWLHIFLHYPNNNKGQALYTFMKNNNITPDDVYVIDDDYKVLRDCEKLGVHCIHPSHLLAEYESTTGKM